MDGIKPSKVFMYKIDTNPKIIKFVISSSTYIYSFLSYPNIKRLG